MDQSDYGIAIYLNQAIVFDLLAIIEDGMAQVSTIKTAETKKGLAEGSIGVSNVFALLGVGLKGSKENQEDRETTSERVHTPTSLFAKVRSRLRKDKLVHDLSNGISDKLLPGHFVEAELRLRRNPLIDGLEAIGETISGLQVLSSFVPSGQQQKGQKSQPDPMKVVADQSKRLLSTLTASNSIDMVGQFVPGPGQAIVPVENRYFGEHSAQEISNGHYRVFGKVVLVSRTESISLLRNTPFAHMPTALDPLSSGFAQTKAAGLSLPDFSTKVEGPVVQILPIAIFI